MLSGKVMKIATIRITKLHPFVMLTMFTVISYQSHHNDRTVVSRDVTDKKRPVFTFTFLLQKLNYQVSTGDGQEMKILLFHDP